MISSCLYASTRVLLIYTHIHINCVGVVSNLNPEYLHVLITIDFRPLSLKEQFTLK